MSLNEKISLVTGSSRGIGAAVARELARRGSTVVVNYRSDEAGATAVCAAIQEAGGTCSLQQADVSAGAEAAALVKEVLREHGQIDILVNNAGLTRDGLLLSMKADDWDIVIRTNLTSVYQVTRPVVRSMIRKRAGRIINVSSVVGLLGQAGQANYAASKAGLLGFTKSLARELGSRGITVNAVAPGFIPTALTAVLPPEHMEHIIGETPLGRMGTPEEVAKAVAFLASDDAAFITGQTLSVDGGLSMR